MKIDFEKNNGLVPAIVQDHQTGAVLMLGYMNESAYQRTLETGKVTFYSRSRQSLWEKGETSGNFLNLVSIHTDCDKDTLLVRAEPTGPVCHKGTDTCFGSIPPTGNDSLRWLERIIEDRKHEKPQGSYTVKLFIKGIPKIAQKVGEEATEVIIDAVRENKDGLKQEAADLMYHLLVLLSASEIKWDNIIQILEQRHLSKRP